MSVVIHRVFSLVFRAVLLLMGLVFFVSLLAAALVLLVLWLVRSLWARMLGRPVTPWAFRVNPRAQWNRFYRAPGQGRASRPAADDVIDVVPREIKMPDQRLQ